MLPSCIARRLAVQWSADGTQQQSVSYTIRLMHMHVCVKVCCHIHARAVPYRSATRADIQYDTTPLLNWRNSCYANDTRRHCTMDRTCVRYTSVLSLPPQPPRPACLQAALKLWKALALCLAEESYPAGDTFTITSSVNHLRSNSKRSALVFK